MAIERGEPFALSARDVIGERTIEGFAALTLATPHDGGLEAAFVPAVGMVGYSLRWPCARARLRGRAWATSTGSRAPTGPIAGSLWTGLDHVSLRWLASVIRAFAADAEIDLCQPDDR